MKILVAEDDRDMARAVSALLTRNHYTVDTADNGRDAFSYLQGGDYDMAVLDIMMPGMSGLEVVQKIRREGKHIPILLLTALGEIEDRVEGLDAGADDYLPKPFDGAELLARVRALLRRTESFTSDIITAGDLSLDRSSYQLNCGSQSVSLNNKCFQVMEMLMLNKGHILSADQIMEHIWGWDSEAEINVIWVNISMLRKHMQTIGSKGNIKAVRGAGYVLEAKND